MFCIKILIEYKFVLIKICVKLVKIRFFKQIMFMTYITYVIFLFKFIVLSIVILSYKVWLWLLFSLLNLKLKKIIKLEILYFFIHQKNNKTNVISYNHLSKINYTVFFKNLLTYRSSVGTGYFFIFLLIFIAKQNL